MNPAYNAYALMSSGLFFSVLPFYCAYSLISARSGAPISERLGLYDKRLRELSGMPRIWIHAVSVGEVNVAGALIQAVKGLMPDCAIFLSTTTKHGHRVAIEKFGREVECLFAPVDFILSVKKAINRIKPDIIVFLETEIWPNWLMQAQKGGIKTALVNGRLSNRSIGGYLKIRPLIKEIFSGMSAFSMIHEADAHRIKQLGAPPERVSVAGNAKYDLLTTLPTLSLRDQLTALFRVESNQPVIVAGSTRGSEALAVLETFKQIRSRFPPALLIIAPRHLTRVAEICTQAHKLGFTYQLRTEMARTGKSRIAPVIILDTIGELPSAYGIATAIFCGGSLVPLGGQNVLEAAVWGKPVFYGPSMDDFLEAKELLEAADGGVQVTDQQDLTSKMLFYLSQPALADAMGRRAREAILSRHGAAVKHALVIYHLLKERSPSKGIHC
jgi:3-deoxy-D-manno-octulosonic-acid transferase